MTGRHTSGMGGMLRRTPGPGLLTPHALAALEDGLLADPWQACEHRPIVEPQWRVSTVIAP